MSILRWREIPPSFRFPLCLTQLESKPFTVLIILFRDAFTLVLASLLWVVATDYSQFPFCDIPVEKSLFPSTFMPSSLSSSPMQSTWWCSDAVIMGEVISVKESKRVEWKNANFFLLLCLLFYWHVSRETEREFPCFVFDGGYNVFPIIFFLTRKIWVTLFVSLVTAVHLWLEGKEQVIEE